MLVAYGPFETGTSSLEDVGAIRLRGEVDGEETTLGAVYLLHGGPL